MTFITFSIKGCLGLSEIVIKLSSVVCLVAVYLALLLCTITVAVSLLFQPYFSEIGKPGEELSVAKVISISFMCLYP